MTIQQDNLDTPTFHEEDKNSTQNSLSNSNSDSNNSSNSLTKKIAKDIKKQQKSKEQKIQKVVCNECGKKYTNKYSLQTHLKTLHKIKPHKCLVCKDIQFWELKDLKHHMEKLHLDFLIEQCRLEKEKLDAEREFQLQEQSSYAQAEQSWANPFTSDKQMNYNDQYNFQQFQQQQESNNQNYTKQQPYPAYQQNFEVILEQEENSSTQSSNSHQAPVQNQDPFYFDNNPQYQQDIEDFNKPSLNKAKSFFDSNNSSSCNNSSKQTSDSSLPPEVPLLFRTNSRQMTKDEIQNRLVYLQQKIDFATRQGAPVQTLDQIGREVNYLIHCLKTNQYSNYEEPQKINSNQIIPQSLSQQEPQQQQIDNELVDYQPHNYNQTYNNENMNNNNNKPLTNVNLSLVKNDSKNFGLDFFSTPKNTDFLDHEFNPINNNHNLLFENFNYE